MPVRVATGPTSLCVTNHFVADLALGQEHSRAALCGSCRGRPAIPKPWNRLRSTGARGCTVVPHAPGHLAAYPYGTVLPSNRAAARDLQERDRCHARKLVGETELPYRLSWNLASTCEALCVAPAAWDAYPDEVKNAIDVDREAAKATAKVSPEPAPPPSVAPEPAASGSTAPRSPDRPVSPDQCAGGAGPCMESSLVTTLAAPRAFRQPNPSFQPKTAPASRRSGRSPDGRSKTPTRQAVGNPEGVRGRQGRG